MISMKMMIDGCEVRPSGVADALQAAILQNIQSQVVSRVGEIICPDHGEIPEIVAESSDLSSLSFMVRGCCDKVVDEVRNRMGEE